MKSLTIIKLGGSVVTHKARQRSFRRDVVSRLANEIRESGVSPLILVHGGGSFGHPIAKEYSIESGLAEPRQMTGFTQTVLSMRELNGKIVEELLRASLPSVGFPGSTIFVTDRGRIRIASLDTLLSCMESGFVPVTCGDAVFDRSKTFTILSGDQIAAYLATRLSADRLIFVVDVDGIYVADPRTGKPSLTRQLEASMRMISLDEEKPKDVTGGIFRKVDEASAAAERGIEVFLLNGLITRRLQDFLSGKETICTRVLPRDMNRASEQSD